jgi:hypothetical protein
LKNQGPDASIILKRIISEVSTETSYRVDGKGTKSLQGQKILRGEAMTGLMWFRTGKSEHGDEPSASTGYWETLDYLWNYLVSKKESTTWT